MPLTRRQLAEYLTANGYPTSVHTLNRLCQPSIGLGPPACGRWGVGGGDLYEPEEGLEWAKARAAEAKDRPRYRIALEHIGRKKPVPKPSMPVASSKPRKQRRA